MLKLTQDEFAGKILVKRSYISQIESGQKIPSDRMMKSICREFGVNGLWLSEGKGDIYNTSSDEAIKIVGEMFNTLSDIEKQVIVEFIKLPSDQREMIMDFMKKMKK
jgi:transcriptional regulator with XRE-family HTH domain